MSFQDSARIGLYTIANMKMVATIDNEAYNTAFGIPPICPPSSRDLEEACGILQSTEGICQHFQVRRSPSQPLCKTGGKKMQNLLVIFVYSQKLVRTNMCSRIHPQSIVCTNAGQQLIL